MDFESGKYNNDITKQPLQFSDIGKVDALDALKLQEFKDKVKESIGNITEGYGELIDGQIDYDIITQEDGKTVYIAQQFFGPDAYPLSNIDVDDAKKKIQERIKTIQDTIVMIQRQSESLPQDFIRIYLDALDGYRNKFILFKHATLLEADKGGYTVRGKKKYAAQKNVNIYNDKVRGSMKMNPVIQTKKTREWSQKEFSTYKNKLTPEEQKRYSELYARIWKGSSLDLDETIEEPPKHRTEKIMLPQDIYQEVSKELFDIDMSLNSHIPGIENRKYLENRSKRASVDSASQTYKNGATDPQRHVHNLLTTDIHEKGHIISGANSNDYNGLGFKGDPYLSDEEGANTNAEGICDGSIQNAAQAKDEINKVVDLGIMNFEAIKNLSKQDALIFIGLSYKMHYGKEFTPAYIEKRYLRSTRFQASGSGRTSYKDYAYYTGQNDIAQELNARQDENVVDIYKKLNSSKLSREQQKTLPETYKNMGKDRETDVAQHHRLGRYVMLRLEALKDGKDDIHIESGSYDEQLQVLRDFPDNIQQRLDVVVNKLYMLI